MCLVACCMTQTSITLCYFVGDDILKSHLMYNKNWAFVPKKNTAGLTRYINDLTLAANKLLGTFEISFFKRDL